MNQRERCLYLIHALQKDMPHYANIPIPADADGQWRVLRALFNVRPPMPVSAEFLQVQDDFLSELVQSRPITDCATLPRVRCHGRISLWQGDLTTLRCDAIVNAANSALLGCFQPNHSCIDNIIHSLAGVQLRLACHAIMQAQGHEEATGTAKITPAYNLPSRYVLHTVGPIISGALCEEDCALLKSCYQACLSLASAHQLQSIAFCCISTGVFHFPPQEAAEIAVKTVMDFLDNTPTSIKQVIFNVFTDNDYQIYQNLLR